MGWNQITSQQPEPVRHWGKIVMTVRGGKQRTSDRHQSGPAAGRTRANVRVKIQLELVAKLLPTPKKEPLATNFFFQRAGTATDNLDVDQTLKWPDGTAAERKGTYEQVK